MPHFFSFRFAHDDPFKIDFHLGKRDVMPIMTLLKSILKYDKKSPVDCLQEIALNNRVFYFNNIFLLSGNLQKGS